MRVRFAPSPTGALHIGSVRTNLYNYLFARQHDGALILRIEDTDQDRLVAGAIDSIYEGLHWLGISWQEGPQEGGPYAPYVQSERLPLYQQHAQEQGTACRTSRGAGSAQGANPLRPAVPEHPAR